MTCAELGTAGSFRDDVRYPVSLPSPFRFGSIGYDSLFLDTNGFVFFGSVSSQRLAAYYGDAVFCAPPSAPSNSFLQCSSTTSTPLAFFSGVATRSAAATPSVSNFTPTTVTSLTWRDTVDRDLGCDNATATWQVVLASNSLGSAVLFNYGSIGWVDSLALSAGLFGADDNSINVSFPADARLTGTSRAYLTGTVHAIDGGAISEAIINACVSLLHLSVGSPQ
jgi:hypothetical protein